jgi:hypothetical protein
VRVAVARRLDAASRQHGEPSSRAAGTSAGISAVQQRRLALRAATEHVGDRPEVRTAPLPAPAALAAERESEPVSFLDETRGRHTLIANQPYMTSLGINRRGKL